MEGLGFEVQGLGLRVCGLGLGLTFGVLRFGVYGLGFEFRF